MKSKFLMAFIFFGNLLFAQEYKSPLNFQNNQSIDYASLVRSYKALANQFPEANLIEIGTSDFGLPIHLFLLSKGGIIDPVSIKQQRKQILFINNGIHAGETCGIDASLALCEELLFEKNRLDSLLEKVVIAIIPAYNIGGMHQRGSFSRANQNGPEEYGFRGNAKNLDLNRDFIKCDSRNAECFTKTFTTWNPNFFIDTHTTNGSDHTYTLTLIPSQKDKLNPQLASYQNTTILPFLFSTMEKRGMSIIPYVYPTKKYPQQGIKSFLDNPRYSSGYASLFNCFSFITEAHVFKPYTERVSHTKAFLETIIQFAYENSDEIFEIQEMAEKSVLNQKEFQLNWDLDTVKIGQLDFKGYDTISRISKVTGNKMVFYNTQKAKKFQIPFYQNYQSNTSVFCPQFYIIPQAFVSVIDRLKWNKVEFTVLQKDTIIKVTSYYINDFQTLSEPFEAHYLHYNIKVKTIEQELPFYKGDYLVSTQQKNKRYLIETLEPVSQDGFFAWNFFDAILQQKEWFSDYAFEPKAEKLLKEDPELNKIFELKKKEDLNFASSNKAQLYFIYKHSKYFEPNFNRFPVYRVEN